MEPAELEQIYKNAREDPSLLSTINVDALLEKIEGTSYLENRTIDDISRDIFEAIDSLGLPQETAKTYCEKLSGYRVVDKICDLRNGRLVRWIRRGSSLPTLTNGGLLMNVKIENSGVQLLCKNSTNRFFNVKFDDCVVFQKLTMEEQIILMANSIE
jgi:hypothetical protein